MIHVESYLNMLGLRVVDSVTGFKGVVVNVGFDLYGCIQAIVHPGIGADGKLMDQQWFDIARLIVVSNEPVMRLPNFHFGPQAEGRSGGAVKPPSGKA